MPRDRKCACVSALQFAVLTAPDAISPAARERLGLLFEKYWNQK
jgi:5'-methylthioadenosine phosphorylase